MSTRSALTWFGCWAQFGLWRVNTFPFACVGSRSWHRPTEFSALKNFVHDRIVVSIGNGGCDGSDCCVRCCGDISWPRSSSRVRTVGALARRNRCGWFSRVGDIIWLRWFLCCNRWTTESGTIDWTSLKSKANAVNCVYACCRSIDSRLIVPIWFYF